ncbi:hypothetical protein LINGRAHAP2_LOCUS35210 [Linum grandiflorum]
MFFILAFRFYRSWRGVGFILV